MFWIVDGVFDVEEGGVCREWRMGREMWVEDGRWGRGGHGR